MKKLIAFCLYFFIFSLYSIKAGERKENLKVSVIIPCFHKHADYLYPLLRLYERQTILPDEIIISLSEANLVTSSVIADIENKQWPFPVKLLLSDNKKYAGTNRNDACREAFGDIFVCQDADDIPHPQRIEMVKYVFENYDVDHLMHFYNFSHQVTSFSFYNAKDIPIWKERNFNKTANSAIHIGCPAISRQLFMQKEWSSKPTKQDFAFYKDVHKSTDKCLIIKIPLLIYMVELSSWPNKNPSSIKVINAQELYDDFFRQYKNKFTSQ